MAMFGSKTVIGSPAETFYLPPGDSFSRTVVVFASNTVAGLPNVSMGLSLNPGGARAARTDENGWVGLSITFTGVGPGGTGDPDGKHYAARGLVLFFPDGIWGQKFQCEIAGPVGTQVDISVQTDGSQGGLTLQSDPPPDDDPGLDKPTNLTCKTVGSDTITLAWKDNSSNETGFFIERRANDYDGGVDWTPVATVAANTTTFDDQDVSGIALAKAVPAGQDVYRVFAFNATKRTVPTAAPLQTGATSNGTPLPQIITGPSLRATGPLPSIVTASVTVVPGTNHTITGYSWEQYSGPSTAVIKSPDSLTTRIEFDTYVPGTYVFAFTVSGVIKNTGQTAPDVQNKVVVVVPEPTAPVVQGGRANLTI